MKQEYDQYTEGDFQVWKILFNRQIALFPDHASVAYLKGLKDADFETGIIPNFEDTNRILRASTGWELEVVAGIVPDHTFFELLADRKFPATSWLRKMKELEYLEEPDMFHDVFAHVPLLTNQYFVNFLEKLGSIGLNYVGNEYAIELLSRVYWYTVEFGLIQEEGGLRIYGAGILSSRGETQFSLSGQVAKYPFDVARIIDTPYKKDKFQTQYFVIDSYEQLYTSLDEVKRILQDRWNDEKNSMLENTNHTSELEY